MRQGCTHAGAIADVPAPRNVCEACIEIGGEWVHLRQCLTCGRTLCCNSSPNRHSLAHFDEVAHPLIRSATPAETWTWCHVDGSMVREAPEGMELYDPFLEAGVRVAAQHARAGGAFDLPEDFTTRHGFPLGEWVAYVREGREEGSLDPDDAALVEAVPGWTW